MREEHNRGVCISCSSELKCAGRVLLSVEYILGWLSCPENSFRSSFEIVEEVAMKILSSSA